MNKIWTIILTILLTSTLPSHATEDRVPYPMEYRSWKHVKSMVIQPGHALENPFQGIHHVYANKKAVEGMKTSQYQDGAILVFDLLNYTEKNKTIQEGSRKLIGIMHRDNKKFSATGGWGFEAYLGDSKTKTLVTDKGASCFGCHMPQASNQYVFSKARP